MSKFRYYVADVTKGCVFGTNDDTSAAEFGECDDFFVIDSNNGEWLVYGERKSVGESE